MNSVDFLSASGTMVVTFSILLSLLTMTALSFFTTIRSNLYPVYILRCLSPPQKADLSDANLSEANMKRANLNEVNLEGTNVEKAVFGKNPGLSERAKLDLEQRGAIFDDSPGDYSSSE